MAIETQLDKMDAEDVRAQRLAMYIYILPNLMTTGNLFRGSSLSFNPSKEIIFMPHTRLLWQQCSIN